MTTAEAQVLGTRIDSLEKTTAEGIGRIEASVRSICERHDECVEHCSSNRREVYVRIEEDRKAIAEIQVSLAGIAAKVAFVWGLVGTLLGGALMFGLLETAKHVLAK